MRINVRINNIQKESRQHSEFSKIRKTKTIYSSVVSDSLTLI